MATTIDEGPAAPDAERAGEGLPTVRDALIGLVIGVGLLFVGAWFSTWWLRWPTIGLGVLFVLVIGGYIIASAWETVSTPLGRVVSQARGHVRTDPQLGRLYRDVKAHAWEGSFPASTGPIELLIDGGKEPNPALVARARQVVAEFPSLERRVATFLAEEAAVETDAELAAATAALRISMFRFNFPDRPDEVEIVFDGPDEDIWWTCLYVGGELKDLTFDS
jgi:hypothetical protein